MTNEEVKEIIDRAENEYERLKDRVHEQYDEIKRLNNCYCNRSDCGGRLNKNNEVYDSVQQRNDKAIEYIEKCKENHWDIDLNDLLDILKGNDNERT